MTTLHPAAKLPIYPKKRRSPRTWRTADDYPAPGGEAAHLSEKKKPISPHSANSG